ncbi:MAG: protein serine/threonine phosphatase 2C family protein [Candidatus Hydrogenedens sp.]|nr:protein serine/threonine phosphatase 2C family protein [Candidatus Hydrogenedens sp.]
MGIGKTKSSLKGVHSDQDEWLSKALESLPALFGRGLSEETRECCQRELHAGLLNVLLPQGWPGLKEEHFSTDLFCEGTPLQEYVQSLNPAKIEGDSMRPVLGLADFLDKQAQSGQEEMLVVFFPEGFFVSPDLKLMVSKCFLSLLAAGTHSKKLSSFQRDIARIYLHPSLQRDEPLSGLSPEACVFYGWILFLADAWLGIRSGTQRSLLDQLERLRFYKPHISPGTVDLFKGMLSDPSKYSKKNCCRDFSLLLMQSFKANPLHLSEVFSPGYSREQHHYSTPGKYKANPDNEDHVGTSLLRGGHFIFVADGVSTADLGSGQEASECIAHVVRRANRSMLHEKMKEMQHNEAQMGEIAHNTLRALFKEADLEIADALNDLAKSHPPEQAVSNPMCSTFTVALVVGNRAYVQSVGDSPALLYHAATCRLMKLSVDHTVAMESGTSPGADSDGKENKPDALTRVCGAFFDGESYKPRNNEAFELTVQLSDGDVLLLATDGLIRSIDAYDEIKALDELERVITDHLQESKTVREMTCALVELADSRRSNDNITVNIVHVRHDQNEEKGTQHE